MQLDEAKKILNRNGFLIEKTVASSNEWNFIVCPADIAKKVLEDAGYDYEGCLLYKGETYVNPQTVEFPNDEPDYIDDLYMV